MVVLDDPVVSRIFVEARFHNRDIKLTILRPAPLLGHLPMHTRRHLSSSATSPPWTTPTLESHRGGLGELGLGGDGGQSGCVVLGTVKDVSCRPHHS
ncbi:hypothetical protein OsJ_00985 [Oryza sativa Japonica Group]|nr:hypothetical protein OsJ_00985 [Oryza sativa Japonica Group]